MRRVGTPGRRVAGLVALVALSFAHAGAGAGATSRRAGVVDTRPLGAEATPRARARAALADLPDVAPVPPGPLRAALLGVAVEDALPPGGPPTCTTATDEALRAWLAAAPLADVRAEVIAVLGRQLACADAAGDRGAALAAARRLGALGEDGGLPAEVWTRYPSVDGIVDVPRQPLEVATEPPGAEVTVDLARAGVAPVAPAVQAGRRLVTAARGERAAARFVEVKENRATQVTVALPAVDEALAPVRARVRAWRRAAAPPPAAEVTALAAAAGLDLVVVLTVEAALVFGARDGRLRPLGRAPLGDEAALRALLATAAPAPAPPTPPKAARSHWIYAMTADVSAAAPGLVVPASTGTATRRIEARWP